MAAVDQFWLGFDFAKGVNGAAKDDAKAFKYFLLAAENGQINAMAVVASQYSDGGGTEKDAQSALRWIKAACDAGNSGAQFSFGTYMQHHRTGPIRIRLGFAAGLWYATGENGL